MRLHQHAIIRWSMGVATFGAAVLAFAGELTFSATVDKTTVDLGSPLTVSITLSGELSSVKVPPFTFPEGFVVAAQSQATNLSMRAGAMERATSCTYVLVPRQAGTFTLGPFTLTHDDKAFSTDPINITVNTPALPPPQLQPKGERFTL